MSSLDSIDLKILNLLQKNGRITNSSLASEIDLSTAATLERVRKLENKEIVKELVAKCLDWYCDCRESYFPTDPSYITEDVKNSDAYKGEIKDLENNLEQMHKELSVSQCTVLY